MGRRIALQGRPGCFSDLAAFALEPGAAIVYFDSMSDAMESCGFSERADAVVVPVHNTIAGDITAHLALIALHPRLRRGPEASVPIRVCLLAARGTRMEHLHRVISHPVALAQCGEFLTGHPQLTPESYFDTAGAAEHVARTAALSSAALASKNAAAVYGLDVLAKDVQDTEENYTRFVLLER